MSCRTGEVPVLHPSLEEFQDFKSYVASASDVGWTRGCVNIVPPAGWKARPSYRNVSFDIVNPVRQHAFGDRGQYKVVNEEQPTRSWGEFQREAEASLANMSSRNGGGSDWLLESPDYWERKFWSNLSYNPALYGADIEGSLFTSCAGGWNLQSLDSCLRKVAQTLPGINTPFLYVGSWKSFFCWHKEDMNLYSINYNHTGAPKVWYVLPPSAAARFETFMQQRFASDHASCNEFLYHKSYLVTPAMLRQSGFELTRIVQPANTFVITWPTAYHCGFNVGFNVAEAVNFGLDDWLEYGGRAKSCFCKTPGGSVAATARIDMNIFREGYSVVPGNGGEFVWLECVQCRRWRRLPHGFSLPAGSTIEGEFLCSHLPGLTCKTPAQYR